MMAMAAKRIGFFSRARWGVGSISFIIILALIGVINLVLGRFRVVYIFESAVIFIIIIIFVLIKAAERITVPGSGMGSQLFKYFLG
ncbi:MAG: hypothetical protein JRN01_06205 [Nitrososphaerota archaeon]|nr:hypothetical protein [Nitrososphaerota archaeon]